MRASLLILALVLLSPVPAGAADTNAPPGNSGVDEYVEAIPGATGSRPAERLGNSPSSPSSLGAETRRQLAALGSDGRAVAGLVAATAPKQAKRPAATPSSGSSAKPSEDVGNVAVGRAAAKVATGSGGLGLLLPVALIAIVAAGAASRLIRRRA
jgi:hypothetical protein